MEYHYNYRGGESGGPSQGQPTPPASNNGGKKQDNDFGAWLLIGGGVMQRRMRRYAKYLACAGSRDAIPLAHLMKAADVGESKAEREALRLEYKEAILGSLRSHLENTWIVDEKGNKRKLRHKGEE